MGCVERLTLREGESSCLQEYQAMVKPSIVKVGKTMHIEETQHSIEARSLAKKRPL
jgi:hypothetical protein